MATVKFLQYSVHPACMVIDPCRKRSFVMSMQLRQCFARAKPVRLKIS